MSSNKQRSVDSEDIMTDADFEKAMAALQEEGDEEVNELIVAMSENRIISWDEAERILGETSNEPIKSSLPQQTRPTEPDNDTDVEYCMQKLFQNDPKLIEINLNNMKRTPVPKIKRMIEAIKDNEYLEKLSLANMGLYDMDLEPLIDVIKQNNTLRCLNLETNYLSGDFFSRLFKAALNNQSIEEIKAVNQGVAFSTQTEREIIEAIMQNRGLTKVSINLRLPEGRFKVEQATIRNQEIRRILRRQMMAEKQKTIEEQKPKSPTKIFPKKELPLIQKEEKKTLKVYILIKFNLFLKRQPSGAAAELAKQNITPKLAIAGVNTPRPIKERAKEADEKVKKPYEPEKNAERTILAEKSKQKIISTKWPPITKIKDSKEEEEIKEQLIKNQKILKKQSNINEKEKLEEIKNNKIPSWRDRMAKKESEIDLEKDLKIGSLALRNKFEKINSKENGEEEKLIKIKTKIQQQKEQQKESFSFSLKNIESFNEEKKKKIIKNNKEDINKNNMENDTNKEDFSSKSPPKYKNIIPPPIAPKKTTLIKENKPSPTLNKSLLNTKNEEEKIQKGGEKKGGGGGNGGGGGSGGYIPSWRNKK